MVEDAIDVCENLPDGYHQPDAAEQLGCCTKTLYNHTNPKAHPQGVIWRIPALYNSEVKAKTFEQRREYAVEMRDGRTGKLKKKYKQMAHADHSWISWYGGNKSHMRQARRRRSRRGVRRIYRNMANPKIHCLFVAHKNGIHVFRHARRLPKTTNRGNPNERFTIKNMRVGAKEYKRALKMSVNKVLKENGVKVLVLDCVRVNHCKGVRKCLKNGPGVKVYPRASKVKGGYPPYSPMMSVLDEDFLPIFKEDVHKLCRNMRTRRNRIVKLYNLIPKLIRRRKYQNLAKKAIRNYHKRLQRAIDTNGEM